MRRSFAVFVVCAIAVLAQPAHWPARAFEMKLCEHCRRNWDDSPSRIRALADANDRQKQLFVCSPFCLATVLKLKPHYELLGTQIVPWEQREELDPPMLATKSARFLIDVDDPRDRSHDPDIAAFRTEKQLDNGQELLGGEVITWDKLLERCKKLAAEADHEVESDYKPKRHRRY